MCLLYPQKTPLFSDCSFKISVPFPLEIVTLAASQTNHVTESEVSPSLSSACWMGPLTAWSGREAENGGYSQDCLWVIETEVRTGLCSVPTWTLCFPESLLVRNFISYPINTFSSAPACENMVLVFRNWSIKFLSSMRGSCNLRNKTFFTYRTKINVS